MILTLIALSAIQGIDGAKSPEHYCAINKAHTMCLYHTFNSMGLRCRHFNALPMQGVRRMMLTRHNSFRNQYASNPKWELTVPNILALEWDDELAEIAAQWAMQCPYYGDDFRDVDRFKVANMVGIGSDQSSFPSLLDVWTSLLQGNVTFHKLPDKSENEPQKKLESAFDLDHPLTLITNPYFQYVGCAAAIYRQFEVEDEIFRTILVCNYGPLDDYYDKYQPTGSPCTHCPDDTLCHQNSSYPNLCIGNSSSLLHGNEKRRNRKIKPRSDWYDWDEEGTESGPLDKSSETNVSIVDELQEEMNKTNHYCDIICDNGALHTMCKYQDSINEFDDAVPLLGKPAKEYILTMHNSIRDDVAGAKPTESGARLPFAANMREMIWSEELEKIARKWVMQCRNGKDECRDIYMEGHSLPVYVSQLIYVANWSRIDSIPSITGAFYSWMAGMPFFTVDELNPYKEPPESTVDYGPFAQIIWAETFMMGCAMSLCQSKSTNDSRVITACNYAPGGMIPGKSVFKIGGPCSECRKLYFKGNRGGFCSDEYRNLCAARFTGGSQFLDFSSIRVHHLELLLFDNVHNSLIEDADAVGVMFNYQDGHSCGFKCYCKGEVHTLCKYKGPSKSCKGLLIHHEAQADILQRHNDLREAIASSDFTRTGSKKMFPRASNMREMIWNEDLAESALRWATQCQNGTDECRDLKLTGRDRNRYILNKHEVPSHDLMRVDQMHAQKEWEVTNEEPSFEELFDQWANEIANFSVTNIRQYVEHSIPTYYHFAQLIWARTFMVGCALVSWETENPGIRKMMLVCNYAPRGRQHSLPVYKIGGPCTHCQPLYRTGTEGRTCSIKLPSLCQTSNKTPTLMQTELNLLLLQFMMLQIKLLSRNYHCHF